MRVVLDTNTIVSAFITPSGKPAAILQLVLRGDFEICFNSAILAEYEQVLYRPKFTGKMHQQAILRFFEIIKEIGVDIIAFPSNINMPDEADRVFYEVAKEASAVLITGNKKHYPREPFIQDPAEFFAQFY